MSFGKSVFVLDVEISDIVDNHQKTNSERLAYEKTFQIVDSDDGEDWFYSIIYLFIVYK